LSLYKESDVLPLLQRRKYQRLTYFYKIKEGITDISLREYLPNTVAMRNPYNTRNSASIDFFTCRTSFFKNSFFPNNSLLEFNQLPVRVRLSVSPSDFKNKLSKLITPVAVPEFFFMGCRQLNVMQARIRNKCSALKNDLCFNHVIDSPMCSLCYHGPEDCNLYFFVCPKFRIERQTMMMHINGLGIPITEITSNLLLNGTEDREINVRLGSFVQHFINSSKRFQ
jgi:hypothetical protein